MVIPLKATMYLGAFIALLTIITMFSGGSLEALIGFVVIMQFLQLVQGAADVEVITITREYIDNENE